MLSPKQTAQPNPSYPMERRLRRKQLNSDTNASNETYLKEVQEKKKKKPFLQEKRKNKKKRKRKEKNKKSMKKKKFEKKKKCEISDDS